MTWFELSDGKLVRYPPDHKLQLRIVEHKPQAGGPSTWTVCVFDETDNVQLALAVAQTDKAAAVAQFAKVRQQLFSSSAIISTR